MKVDKSTTGTLFLSRMHHSGNIDMEVIMIIPFLFYISKSLINSHTNQKVNTALYSIHITPFFAFSFAWRA